MLLVREDGPPWVTVPYGARMDSSVLSTVVVVIGVALFVWWILVLIEALKTPTSTMECR